MNFKRGNKVKHKILGIGIIKYVDEDTAGVRFDNVLEEVPLEELEYILSLEDCISQNYISDPTEITLKILASTITSINDTWGIFSLSRIELLPHQLWVCKRVLEKKPFRWLIADDVGLGKTIEAGLILWPLLSRKVVNRLLILCPASLVMQWQERLRKMFEIALLPYNSSIDNDRSDFWNSNDKVVASFHTLRLDRNNRHNRMLQSKKWDLVIVDEAHHLNAVEHQGETQGYKLIDKLQKNGLIDSMIFFTGTPHRGKDYGFISLLKLLRPDIFNPKMDIDLQLENLQQVMIRNNKENVTDINGKKLFQKPIVKAVNYEFSELEEEFYKMMSNFILSGEAYANNLKTITEKNVVMFVLITLQKIASSSIAAIRKALKNRLRVIQTEINLRKATKQKKLLEEYKYIDENETADVKRKFEEDTTTQLIIELMGNEEKKVQELINFSNRIKSETRIETIINLIKNEYRKESILFFTEYKATQSLLISELIKNFGSDQVVFINGDEKAKDVIIDGIEKDINMKRDIASDLFNKKKARFLVSTEAAGEGIDLQENCHVLFHVDIPWNPMRMQQRVGRINRFGQKRQVEVISIINPDSVESKIWSILDEKIYRIMKAHSSAMNDPEDFKWLILGMQDESFYNNLISEAHKIPKEKFSDWFNTKAKTFSGNDAIKTVTNLVGHSEKFNFDKVSSSLPRFDLPDLQTFFNAMLELNKRRIFRQNESFEFKTPDEWLNRPGMKRRYFNVTYSRKGDQGSNIIGIGNRLMEEALKQALNFDGLISIINSDILHKSLIILRVFDKVTNQKKQVIYKIFGIEYDLETNNFSIINDNQLFIVLNLMLSQKDKLIPHTINILNSNILEITETAINLLKLNLPNLDIPFQYPDISLLSICISSNYFS